MEIFLVQHGDAVPEAEDPSRPLNERGRRMVAKVARAAASSGLSVVQIFHSGKLRAKQTAELMASELKPKLGVRETAGLAPNDDPADAARLAGDAVEPTMIVGHLPHLSRLAALLVVGEPSREIVAFQMGAIVCLSREPGGWRLRWILTPELAGDVTRVEAGSR